MLRMAIRGKQYNSHVVQGPLYQTNLLECGMWLLEGTKGEERESRCTSVEQPFTKNTPHLLLNGLMSVSWVSRLRVSLSV